MHSRLQTPACIREFKHLFTYNVLHVIPRTHHTTIWYLHPLYSLQLVSMERLTSMVTEMSKLVTMQKLRLKRGRTVCFNYVVSIVGPGFTCLVEM